MIRYYESAYGVAAAEWIKDEVQEIIDRSGRDDMSVVLVQNEGFPQPNVVARIEGYDRGGDVVIVRSAPFVIDRDSSIFVSCVIEWRRSLIHSFWGPLCTIR